MKMNRKLRLQLLIQNGLFVVLLIGFAMADEERVDDEAPTGSLYRPSLDDGSGD